jgi:hypothetical protein
VNSLPATLISPATSVKHHRGPGPKPLKKIKETRAA